MTMAYSNMNSVFYAHEYHPIQAGSIDGTDTASHDNGVYRALLASSTGLYDPTGDRKAEGDPYCILFVGRLSHATDEKSLEENMSKYGRVRRLRLVRHIVTGASRRYAFVEFETEEEFKHAYEAAHHAVIDGSHILVDYSRQQLMHGWIPRRLGGGLGGKKESGQLRFGGRDRPFRAPLRPIPHEELKKLGIPLPPEGHYVSRYYVPPPPKRRHSVESKDYHHVRHGSRGPSHRRISEKENETSQRHHSDRAHSFPKETQPKGEGKISLNTQSSSAKGGLACKDVIVEYKLGQNLHEDYSHCSNAKDEKIQESDQGTAHTVEDESHRIRSHSHRHHHSQKTSPSHGHRHRHGHRNKHGDRHGHEHNSKKRKSSSESSI